MTARENEKFEKSIIKTNNFFIKFPNIAEPREPHKFLLNRKFVSVDFWKARKKSKSN